MRAAVARRHSLSDLGAERRLRSGEPTTAGVERPLRLSFQATPERIARREGERGFQSLAQSKKKGAAGAKEQAEGRALQDAIRALVRGLPGAALKDRGELERTLDAAARKAGMKLPAPARKAILSALSERDDTAAICRDTHGNTAPVSGAPASPQD